LRREVLDFVLNPRARALLLRGPIGSGKSTIARCVALLKRVALMTPDHAEQFLKLAKFTGPNQLDVNYLASWYIELPLTGLVESLAELQLFGSSKSAFTGARDTAGVFEAASTGYMPADNKSVGAALTGGIVFMDEVGDLSATLQTKLLPVLSGGAFYRLGTEARRDAPLQFTGIVIAASWRRLDGGRVRPDLLSRIAACTIDVPGVDDRIEDFDVLVDSIEQVTIDAFRNTIEEMLKVDSQLDRGYWRTRMQTMTGVSQAQRQQLKAVSWAKHGHLRGLTAVVEQIVMLGLDARIILEKLPLLSDEEAPNRPIGSSIVERLLERPATGDGLASHLRALELEDRRLLQTQLQEHPSVLTDVAHALGIDEAKLRSQLRTIGRARRVEDRDP
jgi:DNA-binding NtrC family response regulator